MKKICSFSLKNKWYLEQLAEVDFFGGNLSQSQIIDLLIKKAYNEYLHSLGHDLSDL